MLRVLGRRLASWLPASVYAEVETRCEGGAQLRAAGQIRGVGLFGGENPIGGLGVGTDNQRVGNGFQAPAGGNSLDLAGGVGAVTAGADEDGVGAPLDLIQHRVVGAVEEILHEA